MKISPDQNTITLDDGTVLVTSDADQYVSVECPSACAECELRSYNSICMITPCFPDVRNDRRDVIFIKEPKND